jgi:hypothetical protein
MAIIKPITNKIISPIKKEQDTKYINPADISGLNLWLDALDNDTITIEMGEVSQWSDKSGNNNHATQSNAALRPILNASSYNLKPSLLFNVNDYLDVNLTFMAATSYTVFLSIKRRNPNTVCFIGTQNQTPNDGFHICYRTNTIFTFAQYFNDIDITVPAYDFANENGNYIACRLDTTQGHSIFYNGLLTGSNTNTQSLLTGANGVIGAGFDNTTGSKFIGEIIVYNKALTDEEIKGINLYLKRKWSISI